MMSKLAEQQEELEVLKEIYYNEIEGKWQKNGSFNIAFLSI